ncbi:hypothetical protein J3459_017952 [Metarhizium acridum]|nr:hypothetical protein J3459_022400 [Metarhizium acridum]KAG8408285.1 hypothetical protein J3459_017952 [Metarhizium acridum]
MRRDRPDLASGIKGWGFVSSYLKQEYKPAAWLTIGASLQAWSRTWRRRPRRDGLPTKFGVETRPGVPMGNYKKKIPEKRFKPKNISSLGLKKTSAVGPAQ